MSAHKINQSVVPVKSAEQRPHTAPNLAQYVAIFTAIISAFAAVVSYHGTAVQNMSMKLKNDAVIKVTQTVDQWAFYQAKKNKLHMMELASELVPAKADYYRQQIARYNAEKDSIREKAQAIDDAAVLDSQKSEFLMANYRQETQAIMFLQIAIALASITVLTRKKWLFAMAGISAAIGVVLSILSWVAL